MTTVNINELNYRKEGNPLKRQQTTHFRNGWYVWELVCNLELTVDQLAEIQGQQGYGAQGYGIYSPKKHLLRYRSGKTEFKYTWLCATNCD